MKNIRKLFCRIILVVIIFYLGYGVGTLRLFSNRDVFVYDSPTKIRDFYTQIESAIQKEGLSTNHSTTKKFMEELKNKPPLAVVGPLIIFYNKNNGDYSVHERDRLKFITQWTTKTEKTRCMRFYSKIEKDWRYPRVEYSIQYSDDGYYEKNTIFIFDKTGKIMRAYSDTNGDGLFDRMDVFDHGLQTVYSLNGLSYEKVYEKPFGSTVNEYEKILDDIHNRH